MTIDEKLKAFFDGKSVVILGLAERGVQLSRFCVDAIAEK